MPAWFGSPVSLVARRVVPFVLPCAPLMVYPFVKLSLPGFGSWPCPEKVGYRGAHETWF
jgi:hypothetical protein